MFYKYYFKCFALVAALFFVINAAAQNILESEPYARHAYIYKISTDQAQTFFEEETPEYKPEYFQTLVDSFPVNTGYRKNLKQGYYLKVEIENNKVKTALTAVQHFNVFIYNNDKDLNLKVLDLEGKPINKAQVRLKRKNIALDDKTNTYTLHKTNRSGLLSVTYDGQTFFYNLEKSNRLNNFNRVMYSKPLKYIWKPVMFLVDIPVDAYNKITNRYTYSRGSIYKIKRFFVNLYEGTLCLFDKSYCNDPKTFGYAITDKPKYRPGDSIKFKAYLLNKRYKAIDKPLEIYLYKNYKDFRKLGKINPYADGGYTYAFKLTDSLDLKLDKLYTLYLRDENGHEYDRVSFYYEDYTLKGNTLKITSKTETQYKGDSLNIFIEAKDENELRLMDARVEILVRPDRNFKAFEDRIFIPDTLWKINKKLNPKSNTKIIIPPDIFPIANLDYKIEAILKTADNELTKAEKRISYVYRTKDIQSKLTKDTLRFYYTENGEEITKAAKLIIKDSFENKDSIIDIELPYMHKVNPYYSVYEIVADDIKKEIRLDEYSDEVVVSTNRTEDSVSVNVSNPKSLDLIFHTYKTNREIDEGKSKGNLNLKYAANSHRNYYFSLSYLWAGKVVKKNYKIRLNTSELNLNVQQSALVYPGKTDTIRVKVTDHLKEPVEGVDLSAFGLTKKFGYNTPRLPDLQKKQKPKRIINNFSFQTNAFNQNQYSLDIDDWEKKARLDSIIYYDFMYPKGIFKAEVSSNDSITQFAPFVMKDGLQEEVKVVYVDGIPIYTAWNDHEQHYSFAVDSGYYNIKLRTKDKVYYIDSLYFKHQKKTIFSIDANSESPRVKTRYRGQQLSNLEKRQLYPRIMMYDEHDNAFLAFIRSKNRYFLIDKNRQTYYTQKNQITGPVYGEFKFLTYDSLQFKGIHEPNYKYSFYPGYMRLKSVNNTAYPQYFSSSNRVQMLDDKALTKAMIQNIWKEKLLNQRKNIQYRRYPRKTTKGEATLKLIDRQTHPEKIVINTIVADKDLEDFRLYPGYRHLIHDLKPEEHRLIFLFQDMTYQVLDNVMLKPNGLNVLSFDRPQYYLKDFMSSTFNEILNNVQLSVNSKKAYQEHLKRLEKAYKKSEAYFGEGNYITGVVVDGDDLPVPGVNVTVKGTNIGTQTDFDGKYVIKAPSAEDILVFSYVGFKTVEESSTLAGDVQLIPDLEHLDEVVVTSYMGILSEAEVASSSLTESKMVEQVPLASIEQVLQGNVAGANVSYAAGQPGQAATVVIRGRTSLNSDTEPLYIVDGIPVNQGDFRKLSSDDIAAMKILKGAAATAIYGNRGASGVIVIDTFSGGNPLQENPEMAADSDFYAQNTSASSIRNNFSDVAYWQPELRTNKNGEASFIVTYPDDITNWQTIVLAMNENRQSGSYQSFVKAYKPVSARLYTPKFLIEGDQAKAIGKTLNYTKDTLDIRTALEVNGKQVFSKDQTSNNAKIDTLNIRAKGDTLQLTYKLQQKNSDYFDGEKRSIPVYRKGVEVKEGDFRILMPGDTLDYKAKPDQGSVKVYAEADALNLLESDMDFVINYRYDCNEQLASRLNMLLSKQEIYKHLSKDFKEGREIKKIIRTLQKNRNNEKLWGWWKSSKETNYWISQHVIKALLKAKKAEYNIDIDEKSLSIYLKNEYYKDISTNKKIEILLTLSLLKNKPVVSLNDELKSIFHNKDADLNQKLKISLIAGLFDLEPDIEFLEAFQGEDMLGNMYFDYDKSKNYWIGNNRIRNTVLAYQLIRKVNPKDERLPQILLYLLNTKTEGRYVNTYQATNIMETILPDLLQETTEKPAVKISINSAIHDDFPYKNTFNDENVNIINIGNLPVYLTAYQHYFKTEPNQMSNDFEIESYFIDKLDNAIKNGEEVTLKVTLSVKKEAEYTMLNIPIPGGFDYTSKPVNYGLEDHREYFKHETSIFCSQLKEGEYTFEVPLIAKYSGTYNLNPAKVELMYFPTFHAHEGLKTIKIK
jgi:TonB-dependent SusC/RagA subfamily outer membrane receptor